MINGYEKYTLEDYTLLSIYSVVLRKKRCTYSDLVKESFILFPKQFSLSEFPKWPDSLKLDRPLRELRERGLIKGNPNVFYTLTIFGREEAKRLKTSGKNINIDKNVKPSRSPSSNLLNVLEKSKDFQEFINNKENYQINDMRLRSVIGFTLESPKSTILNFLNYLYKQSITHKRNNLTEFIKNYIDGLK